MEASSSIIIDGTLFLVYLLMVEDCDDGCCDRSFLRVLLSTKPLQNNGCVRHYPDEDVTVPFIVDHRFLNTLFNIHAYTPQSFSSSMCCNFKDVTTFTVDRCFDRCFDTREQDRFGVPVFSDVGNGTIITCPGAIAHFVRKKGTTHINNKMEKTICFNFDDADCFDEIKDYNRSYRKMQIRKMQINDFFLNCVRKSTPQGLRESIRVSRVVRDRIMGYLV